MSEYQFIGFRAVADHEQKLFKTTHAFGLAELR